MDIVNEGFEESYITTKVGLIFIFKSVGKHGVFEKKVTYSEIYNNVFNLSLCTIINVVDDYITIIDNGDGNKIFSTVYSTFYDFFKNKPDSYISIKGNNTQKKNVYSYIVSRYKDDLIKQYKLYGVLNDITEDFCENISYDIIMIKKI